MSGLPEGWVTTSLDAVGILHCGQSPSSSTVNRLGRGTPYFTGPEQWDGNELGSQKWTTDPQRIVPEGCIFITVKGAGVGTIFPGLCGAIGRDIYAYQPVDGLDFNFTIHALQQNISTSVRAARGVIPGLTRDDILGQDVLLPPLPEQRRIVAKIDSLTAKSSRARDHLDHIPRLVEKYKQAVLAAGFRGELTRERTDKPWLSTTVEEIALAVFDGPFGSNLKSADYADSGIRVVRLENIGHLRFIFDKKTYISQEKYKTIARHTLYPDDIVVSSFVADEMRVCRFPAGLNVRAINKADCFCVRVDTNRCIPRFLELRLASQETYKELEGAVHGATRPRISLSQLRSFQFFLPSLDEQQDIVRRIERAFTWIDRLAAEATSARTLVDRLDQAVLAKAFRGELVPQDPADEPASVLLDHIRAVRAAAPKPKRGRRPRAAE